MSRKLYLQVDKAKENIDEFYYKDQKRKHN